MDTTRLARKLSTQFLIISTMSCAAFGGTLAPGLRAVPATRSVEVIVEFSDGANTASVKVGTKLADLPHSALYRMSAGEAASLATQEGVDYVAPNNMVYATGSSAPVYDFTPWAIQEPLPGLPLNFLAGQGIGVAVIDSGITVNSDLNLLGSAVVYSKDYTGSGTTNDQFGHGTHIAGIVAGNGVNSLFYPQDIHGVAPGVQLINLKVLDQNGLSTDALVMQAIADAITLRTSTTSRSSTSLWGARFTSPRSMILCAWRWKRPGRRASRL